MKQAVIYFFSLLLLFSVAAETFSALYQTNAGHMVLGEKEETEKEDKIEKEEQLKDKMPARYIKMEAPGHYHNPVVNMNPKQISNLICKGFAMLPKLPPKSC
jgi:hypothetical protein